MTSLRQITLTIRADEAKALGMIGWRQAPKLSTADVVRLYVREGLAREHALSGKPTQVIGEALEWAAKALDPARDDRAKADALRQFATYLGAPHVTEEAQRA